MSFSLLSQNMGEHGLAARFHLLPFTSAANLWLPGRPVIT